MALITTRSLGLAAYIKLQGATLVSVDNRTFSFTSDKPLSDWRVAYNDSCCCKHDAIVMELRDRLKEGEPCGGSK